MTNLVWMRRLGLFLVLALATFSAAQQEYGLTLVAEGLEQPLGLTHAGDGSNRLFIVEKTGRVRVLRGGELLETPFLDLSLKVSTNSERGLLDIAFHPNYPENRLVFVHYNDTNGNTVLAEFQTSEDGTQLLTDSETVLLTVEQPYANHNGGELEFGPDGYLYMALGDGGSGGDPEGNGQNLDTLLGSILRLGVDEVSVGEGRYAIPEDNPFVNGEGARRLIWAYGLRNPWRFSFDRETGDLWIADVGQNQWEEVNKQDADSAGGENYGWNIMEGGHCYQRETCSQEGLTLPLLEYDHSVGNSITGGYVYRGAALPELVGSYLFADFGNGNLWRAAEEADDWTSELLQQTGMNISSFGEDEAGELYIVDFGIVDFGGAIYRLTAAE